MHLLSLLIALSLSIFSILSIFLSNPTITCLDLSGTGGSTHWKNWHLWFCKATKKLFQSITYFVNPNVSSFILSENFGNPKTFFQVSISPWSTHNSLSFTITKWDWHYQLDFDSKTGFCFDGFWFSLLKLMLHHGWWNDYIILSERGWMSIEF